MFGLGAYASSSSGDEAENVKVDEAPPAASPESLFANDPRVPKEPAGEVDPATVAHWQKTVSASGSALEALLKDKAKQDPGFVAAAIREYEIDPDGTNLPASIWNPKKFKEDLPQFLSALKEEEMAGSRSDKRVKQGVDSGVGTEVETRSSHGDEKGPERKRKKAGESRWDK